MLGALTKSVLIGYSILFTCVIGANECDWYSLLFDILVQCYESSDTTSTSPGIIVTDVSSSSGGPAADLIASLNALVPGVTVTEFDDATDFPTDYNDYINTYNAFAVIGVRGVRDYVSSDQQDAIIDYVSNTGSCFIQLYEESMLRQFDYDWEITSSDLDCISTKNDCDNCDYSPFMSDYSLNCNDGSYRSLDVVSDNEAIYLCGGTSSGSIDNDVTVAQGCYGNNGGSIYYLGKLSWSSQCEGTTTSVSTVGGDVVTTANNLNGTELITACDVDSSSSSTSCGAGDDGWYDLLYDILKDCYDTSSVSSDATVIVSSVSGSEPSATASLIQVLNTLVVGDFIDSVMEFDEDSDFPTDYNDYVNNDKAVAVIAIRGLRDYITEDQQNALISFVNDTGGCFIGVYEESMLRQFDNVDWEITESDVQCTANKNSGCGSGCSTAPFAGDYTLDCNDGGDYRTIETSNTDEAVYICDGGSIGNDVMVAYGTQGMGNYYYLGKLQWECDSNSGSGGSNGGSGGSTSCVDHDGWYDLMKDILTDCYDTSSVSSDASIIVSSVSGSEPSATASMIEVLNTLVVGGFIDSVMEFDQESDFPTDYNDYVDNDKAVAVIAIRGLRDYISEAQQSALISFVNNTGGCFIGVYEESMLRQFDGVDWEITESDVQCTASKNSGCGSGCSSAPFAGDYTLDCNDGGDYRTIGTSNTDEAVYICVGGSIGNDVMVAYGTQGMGNYYYIGKLQWECSSNSGSGGSNGGSGGGNGGSVVSGASRGVYPSIVSLVVFVSVRLFV